jgi:rhamnose utilization protein RhaD (predicted bifunctional aldolase and dehydrogenase)
MLFRVNKREFRLISGRLLVPSAFDVLPGRANRSLILRSLGRLFAGRAPGAFLLMNQRLRIEQDLLTLSKELGREERRLAILAEGNTSARLSEETLLIKASGACLHSLKKDEIVECRFSDLRRLQERTKLTDSEIDDALLASRVNRKARKPSLEAIFHAYLLSLPGMNFAGHTHATNVLSVVSSPRAKEFAEKRIYPDEAGTCGIQFVFVPYCEPGLELAQSLRRETERFLAKHGVPPRVILMQNHGVITLGGTWQAVLASMLMCDKAAGIFIGAAALGGPVFLTEAQARRFNDRPDEVYRRRALKM